MRQGIRIGRVVWMSNAPERQREREREGWWLQDGRL